MEGVEPLEGDERVPAPAPGRRRPRESRARAASFTFSDPDDRSSGVASGASTSQLRKLQRGEIRPDRRVDLHRMNSGPARRACLEALRSAAAAGERCVLVVHGKGLRSEEGPVLRPALPDWLADPSLEGRVLAFAPARPADGGRGATYVLLRRKRQR